jgi:hypothetical protein
MKMTIRSAVIAALGVAGATAANAANITVPLPSTGASDLLLFINDTSTSTTYTRVLTSNTVASVFNYGSAPAGTEGALTTYTGDSNFTVNTGADASEVSFITNAEAAGDTLQWGIIAGAYTAPTSTPGNAVAIATASDVVTGTTVPGAADASIVQIGNSTLANTMLSTASGLGKDITKLTGASPANSFDATTKGIFGTPSSQSLTNLTFYGAGVQMSGLALGSSSTLYAVTASPGTFVDGYSLGTITLSADGSTLSFVGNTGTQAVPLPAAVWLLGSGLVGLAGIGRRRAAKATA